MINNAKKEKKKKKTMNENLKIIYIYIQTKILKRIRLVTQIVGTWVHILHILR